MVLHLAFFTYKEDRLKILLRLQKTQTKKDYTSTLENATVKVQVAFYIIYSAIL